MFENLVNASPVTLSAVENNRHVDDLFLASNWLLILKRLLMKELNLRVVVVNCVSGWLILTLNLFCCAREDLASNFSEIDLESQTMPDSNALGLAWDVEVDMLRVLCREIA